MRKKVSSIEAIKEILIGLTPVWIVLLICLLHFAWHCYKEFKFDAMWDGKPWDEEEYQRLVKKWEKDPPNIRDRPDWDEEKWQKHVKEVEKNKKAMNSR
ncbi:MAG: hypothetical protein NC094_09070 [Bacteroidales bacterium]|nr:hypothetical protein [Bacteroidales bacterium]